MVTTAKNQGNIYAVRLDVCANSVAFPRSNISAAGRYATVMPSIKAAPLTSFVMS